MHDENQHLTTLEKRLQLIRDLVQNVSDGFGSALFVHGEAGVGKSHTVIETLKSLHRPFVLTNSRVSGKALFDLLKSQPDSLHLLEDVESLFTEKHAFGVLRSCLWSNGDRLVTWQTARGREAFIFRGGMVVTSNRDLNDIAELRAVRSRITSIQFQPGTEEIKALMRKVASQGYSDRDHRLMPEECQEVANEVISRSEQLPGTMNMRTLINAFRFRLQWMSGSSHTHWLDLLKAQMEGQATPPTVETLSREDRKKKELAVAQTIRHLPRGERLAAWKKETGKSEPALYRHLEELRKQQVVARFEVEAN